MDTFRNCSRDCFFCRFLQMFLKVAYRKLLTISLIIFLRIFSENFPEIRLEIRPWILPIISPGKFSNNYSLFSVVLSSKSKKLNGSIERVRVFYLLKSSNQKPERQLEPKLDLGAGSDLERKYELCPVPQSHDQSLLSRTRTRIVDPTETRYSYGVQQIQSHGQNQNLMKERKTNVGEDF